MKKLSKWILYFLFGLTTLLFFIYLSFPSTLLKERIANTLTRKTKSIVTIKDLSLSFPLSMTLHDIRVIQPNIKSRLRFERAEVTIGFLRLLTFSIDASIKIIKNESSYIDLRIITNGLPKAYKEKPLSSFELEAHNFRLSDLMNFGVRYQSLNSNSLGLDLLAETTASGGLLNGTVSLDSMDEPSQSEGDIDLKISDLELKNPSLANPQNFKQDIVLKAKIKAEKLEFTNPLQLKSEELNFKISGLIHKPLERPVFDLKLDFDLMGGMKNILGNLLSSYKNTDGQYGITIKGGMYNPVIRKAS